MASQELTVQREPRTDIDKLKVNLQSRADEFKAALPAHISIEKFQRTIATAAMTNPRLLQCDRRSLLLASMKIAQDGLLPDGREAALVPFKNRAEVDGQWVDVWEVQAMPMAYGIRKKILQSGAIVSLETGVIYRAEIEGGNFIYEIGMDPPIRHRPSFELTLEQMGDDQIVGAYSIARIKAEGGGDPYWSVEVMRRSEIDKVRQTSQTGAVGRTVKFGRDKGKAIEPKGPWVDWFGEMARKTVLRRHSKVLPMSGDLIETLERDLEEESRAESAARILASQQPDEPEQTRLPSAEQLDQAAGGLEQDHDAETGEVSAEQDQATGMTEVDEESARALDAGPADDEGEWEPDNGMPETDANGQSASDVAATRLLAQILACTTRPQLKKADQAFVNERASLNEEAVLQLERALGDQRRTIEAGK